jgi:hypothetical protein
MHFKVHFEDGIFLTIEEDDVAFLLDTLSEKEMLKKNTYSFEEK